MAELNVIILNWNAAADTIRCVRQLADWQQIHPQVWVVDNASAEDDARQIALACPHVQLICNSTNQGFAGGTNRGIEAALVANEGPILFLNNDATVSEATIQQLLQTLAENPRIGIVGPLLYHTGTEELNTAGSGNPVWAIHNQKMTIPAGQALIPADYISGSVALIRGSLLRQVGLLDEGYFFNMEVADWCQRAHQQGYTTAVDTRARAHHDVDRSVRWRSTLYVYYVIRNRFRYIRKFYTGWRLPLLLFWGIYGLLLSAKLGLRSQRGPARAVGLGTLDGLRGRFGGQNERVLAYVGK